jgi:uncharacterized RDD family membrane protein YckC
MVAILKIFILRICAASIDLLILITLGFILEEIGIYLWPRSLILFLYYPFFEAMLSSTPGKQILGIRVANLYGHKISLRESCMRHILRGPVLAAYLFEKDMPYFLAQFLFSFLTVPIYIALIINYPIMFFTKNKQCLHDLLSRTVVRHDPLDNKQLVLRLLLIPLLILLNLMLLSRAIEQIR